jgi:Trk K+ transport system NAD-binding subunit
MLTGQRLGHIGSDALTIFTLTALVTLIGSTYLITYGETVYRWFRPFLMRFGHDYPQPEDPVEAYTAWVFGYHRIGWKLCVALQRRGVRFAVVDDNPEAIAKLKERGIPARFGDAADIEFLESLPLEHADLIVSTIPDRDTQLVLLRHLRDRHAHAKTIVTTEHLRERTDLEDRGADYVIMPHLLGGTWMGDVLEHRPWTDATFAALRREEDAELKLPRSPRARKSKAVPATT